MAIYRNIRMEFWTDSKVVDDFTPEDRYFYLYLLTNPHTNLSGCYEVSLKQVSDETGYTKEVVSNLLHRFEKVHGVIRYSKDTKEILLLNWNKFNWNASPKTMKSVMESIERVKNADFKAFLTAKLNGEDTVSIQYPYDMDTTVTDTDTVTDADANTITDADKKSSPNYADEFERLWSMYPNKKGKDVALKKYIKARKEGTTYEEVEKGVLAYKEQIRKDHTESKFIKHGSTFFSQKAWEDEYASTQYRERSEYDDANEQAVKDYFSGGIVCETL